MDKGADSHCHVCDTERFPYSPEASYRPPEHEAGTVGQFTAVLDAHRLSHALLVSPTSGYLYDNRCMLAAIREGKGRFKGIARVRPDIDDRALAELRDGGAIGFRVDLVADGGAWLQKDAARRLLERAREMGWLVQVQCERDQLHDAAPALRAAQAPLIFDHCGRPDAERGVDRPGFKALLDFGREGHYV